MNNDTNLNPINTSSNEATHDEKRSRLAKGDGMARRIVEMERQIKKAQQRALHMHQMAQSADGRVKQKQERLEQLKNEAERMKAHIGRVVVPAMSQAQVQRVEKDLEKAVKELAAKFKLSIEPAAVKVQKNGTLSMRVAAKPSAVDRKATNSRPAKKAA